MLATTIVKTVGATVASIGVGTVVSNAVKTATPEDAERLTKASMVVGGFVLSGIASDFATRYVSKNVDEFTEAFSQHLNSPTE